MATINMHILKFEIEIPKQTWLMLRKPCRLQTDGRTDGQGESSIPPSNFVGRGYNKVKGEYCFIYVTKIIIYTYILVCPICEDQLLFSTTG